MVRKIIVASAVILIGLGIVCLFYLNQPISSQIIISDRMSEFIDIVDRYNINHDEKILVIDIDDTTIMSSKLVGSPTWFYNAVNSVRQSGAARVEAYQVVTEIDRVVQENVMVKAVENSTVRAIKNWQNQGAIVIALTSRPSGIARTTEIQLGNVGLDLSSEKFACIEKKWKPKFGIFKNGIIYTGDFSTKSEAFSQFYSYLSQCDIDVSLIAHADDQGHYVSELSRFAKSHRVPFIGIIYGGASSHRNFDLGLANRQLFELEETLGTQIIPDQYRPIFVANSN